MMSKGLVSKLGGVSTDGSQRDHSQKITLKSSHPKKQRREDYPPLRMERVGESGGFFCQFELSMV